MRGEASGGLFEDQQDGNAAQYRKQASVHLLMQAVQALQIMQKVAGIGRNDLSFELSEPEAYRRAAISSAAVSKAKWPAWRT
jgi:hypothetical protein